MKKFFSVVSLALGMCFSLSAQAQFSPTPPFTTVTNQCGTFFLSGGNYFNAAGTNLGSTLPACGGSMSTQNSASVLVTGGSVTGVMLGTPISTVAALPTCNAAAKGNILTVSDATSPTYNGALTGGGAVSVPVFCNGSAWVSH